MVQDSLIDYVGAQMKLGLSRDAIKTALVGAGWQAADVEDTLKKVEMGKAAQPAVGTSPVAAASAKPAGAPATASTLRMSDLISASEVTAAAKPAAVQPVTNIKKDTPKDMTKEPTEYSAPAQGGRTGKGAIILDVIGGVLILGLGAAAVYFYLQNNDLAGKVASLNTQSSSVASQLTGLQQTLDASTTALNAQMQTLTAQNQETLMELSFFAPTPGGSNSPAVANLKGTISGGGKASFAITTGLGAKIFVVNSKDSKVVTALTPFIGSSTSIAGSYVPGSDALTVMTVNGVDISTPPVVSTTTATSTTGTTGGTTATTTINSTTTLPPPPAPPGI